MLNVFLSYWDDLKLPISEALLDALVAILGVFLVLVIIILSVSLLGALKGKKRPEAVESENKVLPNYSKVDENDENMMAAVLVASIDFFNETKKAPQVLGVREIK